MNKELLKYIKELSLKDKKTLSQKALKVAEESGELAKVVLPYDNADGTTHRFVEKERVLEESVDVILTAISMAYDIGYGHQDIEDMMWRKSEKWQKIQTKDSKVEYPIPYEIHITVDLSTIPAPIGRFTIDGENRAMTQEEGAISLFKEVCKEIGVKPIVLDLENGGESVVKDVMTSSHIITDNKGAYEECIRISEMLEENSFKVVRKKIETVPWHPAAPSEEGDNMPKDCYFEAHIGCVITQEQKSDLEEIAQRHNAHLSRNFFKKMEDGKFVNMITLRHYEDTYTDFECAVVLLKDALDSFPINYEKVITEFSIYDTKVSHDFNWLDKKEEIL